jgi:hypothetical protein
MINIGQATELAKEKISIIEKKGTIRLALLESETMAFEFGWVFFYQSEMFVRTGDEDSLVGGNAPILIDKYDGSVHLTGTSKSIEDYIEEYCKNKKSQ